MDETHPSRVSDAAATRKRRSSILKSQRQPRTPFSELEFNVATPTDCTKSRRVSFSRRTGVAEFVTNEATTTWKNFYEEHNKSLELSGNESGVKSVGHIGQTMFDRQFQEVEAVDFITSLDNLACGNINMSLNNFTEQLASLESTSDNKKLAASQNKFELSAFTDQHSKFFVDDLALPTMGEMSGRINVNFSITQNVAADIGDDLDEIQRDLQNVQSNVVGPPMFRKGRDISEYIEVELNSTHVNFRNDESDMSITETIQSPKLNISRNKTSSDIQELDLDKENKCTPDIEPKIKTFICEMDDLCADMSITSAIPTNVVGNLIKEVPDKATVIDKKPEKRKTIIFDDDLGNLSMTKPIPAKLLPIQSDILKSNVCKLGHTNSFIEDSVKNVEETANTRRRTIVYEQDDVDANMSVTVAIPQNIYEDLKKSNKRNTVVFGLDNADMSITVPGPAKNENIQDSNREAIPSYDVGTPREGSEKTKERDVIKSEKRKTILFDDDLGNLSITKPIPAKLIPIQSGITADAHKLSSLGSAIPTNVVGNLIKEVPEKSTVIDKKPEKRKTIIFDDDFENLSMTKPIPAKLLPIQSDILKSNVCKFGHTNSLIEDSVKNIEETTNTRRRTIVYEQDDVDANMSVTVAIPQNIYEDLNKSEKRNTIVFGIENADMSMTMPMLPKIVDTEDSTKQAIPSHDADSSRKETSCIKTSEKRKTIVFDDDLGNLSMTKPIPAKLLPIQSDELKSNVSKNNEDTKSARRRTIVYAEDDADGDMSVTVAIPQNIYEDLKKSEKRNTIVFGLENADMSMTMLMSPKKVTQDLIKQAIPSSDADSTRNEIENIKMPEKRKTIVFDDDLGNLSMTKPIPAKLLPIQSDILKANVCKLGHTNSFIEDSIKNVEETTNTRRRTIVYEQNDVDANMSVTVAIPQNIYEDLKKSEKRNTIVFGLEDADMSTTTPMPPNIVNAEDSIEQANPSTDADSSRKETGNVISEKRKTIVFDDDLGNLSMTKPIPAKLLPIQNDIFKSNACKLGPTNSFIEDSVKNLEETTNTRRRRTIVYEQDDVDANMSVTVAIPQNIYEDLKKSEKRNTIVFGLENADMSISTPLKILEDSNKQENLRIDSQDNSESITIEAPIKNYIYEMNDIDMAIASNVSMNVAENVTKEPEKPKAVDEISEKRKTLIFDDDLGNLSMTKPISAKLIPLQSDVLKSNVCKLGHTNSLIEDSVKNIEETANTRRRTIVYEQDDVDGDMSVTVAIPQNIYEDLKKSQKRNTIVFGLENADISIFMPDLNKQADVAENLNKEFDKTVVPEENCEKRKTIIFSDQLRNASMTKSVPATMLRQENNESITREAIIKTDVCEIDNFNADVSIKSAMPNIVDGNLKKYLEVTVEYDKKPETRKSIFDDCLGNLSVAKSVPATLQRLSVEIESAMLPKDNNESLAIEAKVETDLCLTSNIPTNVTENTRTEQQKSDDLNENSEKEKIIIYDNSMSAELQRSFVENKDIMLSEDNNEYISRRDKSKSNVYGTNHFNEDTSVPSAIPKGDAENSFKLPAETKDFNTLSETRKSLFDDVIGNLSLTTKPVSPEKQTMSTDNECAMSPQDSNKSVASESKVRSYLDVMGNLSVTKPVSPEKQTLSIDNERAMSPQDSNKSDASESKVRSYLDVIGNLSVTKPVSPENQTLSIDNERAMSPQDSNKSDASECKVRSYLDVIGNLSETKPVSPEKQTLSIDNELATSPQDRNKSIASESKVRSYVHEIDNTNTDTSISSIPTNITGNVTYEAEKTKVFDKSSEKRKTVVFDDELNNSSMAKPIPAKLQRLSIENKGTMSCQNESVAGHANKDIVVCKVFTDETSEIKIPPYLKNVSEDIKLLMNDLVKPMADIMPFGSSLDKSLKPSTCNTEMQADMATSSQIDLITHHEENLNTFTVIDEPRSLISSKNENGNESDNIHDKISLLDSQSDKLSQVDVFNPKEISFRPHRAVPEITVPCGDLIFDYHNPLNNVLLVPSHNAEVHKYYPTRSNDTLCEWEHSISVQKDIEVQKAEVHYNVDNDTGKVDNKKIPDTQSFLSNVSKAESIDQSVDAKVTDFKDSEVNTLIVMKRNSELLQASSSLTLVYDAVARNTLDIEKDTQGTNSHLSVSTSRITSPVKVIYKISSEEISSQIDSDMMTNTEEKDVHKHASRLKKRSYSPSKQDTSKTASEHTLDVTPKPISKMQKLSNSPKPLKSIAIAHFNDDNALTDKSSEIESDSVMSAKDKKSPKSRNSKKPGTSITVQQLMAEYNIEPNIDHKILDQKILEALNQSDSSVAPNTCSRSDVSGIKSPDLVSSFTSSKNQGKISASEVDMDCDAVESNVSQVMSPGMESSTSRISECESSLNVVAKIDMLPFMGSHECEWESSGMDSWSFRLLHARLRLLVRLQHRHHNAARTRVRADTPVKEVTVQRIHRGNEDKNSVASVCIGFAADAMQRMAVGCARAGDVPALLRSAAVAARQARRWGRAMHRARAHLAYKLADEGITLNVANIPLRCVWEVRMRLEMVYEPEGSVPWPRACVVQAKNVLTSEIVSETKLKRALARVPTGWGHVPTAVWQIFRFLKNKNPDDELLGI